MFGCLIKSVHVSINNACPKVKQVKCKASTDSKNSSGVLTVEGSLVGDVVDEEDAHRAAIIGCRDGAETLLASRIPDLQLHTLAVQLDGADLEVDADGGDERGREGVFTESQQTA